MYLYIFKDDKFQEEMCLNNYSEFDIQVLEREILDKNGKAMVFRSETRLEDPTIEKFKVEV